MKTKARRSIAASRQVDNYAFIELFRVACLDAHVTHSMMIVRNRRQEIQHCYSRPRALRDVAWPSSPWFPGVSSKLVLNRIASLVFEMQLMYLLLFLCLRKLLRQLWIRNEVEILLLDDKL